MSDQQTSSLRPSALIDFPKLEPGHVWLMAVMASLSREPLDAQAFEDASAVVETYRKLYRF